MQDSETQLVAERMLKENTVEEIEQAFKPTSLVGILLRNDFDGTCKVINAVIACNWQIYEGSFHMTACQHAVIQERIYRKVKELYANSTLIQDT